MTNVQLYVGYYSWRISPYDQMASFVLAHYNRWEISSDWDLTSLIPGERYLFELSWRVYDNNTEWNAQPLVSFKRIRE